MKDIVNSLKRARSKCTDTIDKSTLSELDIIIQQLEEKTKTGEKPKQINWLSCVFKAMALIRLLTGDFDGGE